ncbi:MAG: hypothetical protein PHX68_00975 [Alphaproteobacteria bacterium]|nr:hypothetical protein [Alphaproteobacteria bacterium]
MTRICPFFKNCGGCLYWDLPDEAYVAKKENFVRRAFADRGIDIPLSPLARIPVGTRRRACFAFHNGHLGFNAAKSHRVVDIDACPMLTPALSGLIAPLRAFVRQHIAGSGDIFVLDTPFGHDIHIKRGKDMPDLPLLEALADFGRFNPVARLLFNGQPIFETTALPFPPDVFLQPSQAGEDALVRLVIGHAGNARTAVDLFCGTGTFTKPLIARGIRTMGYDADARSVACLGAAGIVRDLFRNPLLPDELAGIDLAVIDPPRAGARAQTEQLAQSNIPAIVMISCNPATAARDGRMLVDAGWTLADATPVDQFTYSNHIELACLFKK